MNPRGAPRRQWHRADRGVGCGRAAAAL